MDVTMIPRILAARKTMPYAWFSFPICTLTSCEELNPNPVAYSTCVNRMVTWWWSNTLICVGLFDHQAGCDTLFYVRHIANSTRTVVISEDCSYLLDCRLDLRFFFVFVFL